MTDTLTVCRDIAASPHDVYAAISDVTRMDEWSEECYACEWHNAFVGPDDRDHLRWAQPQPRPPVDNARQGHRSGARLRIRIRVLDVRRSLLHVGVSHRANSGWLPGHRVERRFEARVSHGVQQAGIRRRRSSLPEPADHEPYTRPPRGRPGKLMLRDGGECCACPDSQTLASSHSRRVSTAPWWSRRAALTANAGTPRPTGRQARTPNARRGHGAAPAGHGAAPAGHVVRSRSQRRLPRTLPGNAVAETAAVGQSWRRARDRRTGRISASARRYPR